MWRLLQDRNSFPRIVRRPYSWRKFFASFFHFVSLVNYIVRINEVFFFSWYIVVEGVFICSRQQLSQLPVVVDFVSITVDIFALIIASC